jgi:DNA-binding PadR family transcriptional regulator
MRSLNRLGSRPMSLPLSADDIVEFHAARLLLLISICGVNGRIDGLTKMAKMDFFARYPDFFEVARKAATMSVQEVGEDKDPSPAVESAMIRHHYGPWDKRYYQVLAVLEAKRLVSITKEGRSFRIALTDLGKDRAEALLARPSFQDLTTRMRDIKRTFGDKSGNAIKKLIYELFDTEIRQRPIGEMIER